MPKPGRLSLQVQTLGLGLLLWAIFPISELWALVAGYFGAWLIAQLSAGKTPEIAGPTWLRTILIVALVSLPVAALWRLAPDFEQDEGLVGLRQHTKDRLRLEADPSIAPALIMTDRPQTFYVKATGAREVSMTLGAGGPKLSASKVASSEGDEELFLVAYDPRRDGLPAGAHHELETILELDGRQVTRSLRRVDPEPHPRWFCSHPGAGLAAVPSEESDELIVLSRDGTMRRTVTGDGPADCAFFEMAGEVRIAVAHRYEEHLSILDATSLEPVRQIELGPFQARLAVNSSGSHLAVALAGLEPKIAIVGLTAEVDDEAHEEIELEEIELDVVPDWIAFGRDGSELAVSSAPERTLCRFRRGEAGWSEDAHLWLGRPVVTLTSSHGGERIFLAVTDYRPDGEDHRGNHFIQDQILTLDVETWEVTSQAITGRRTERQQYPGSLDSGTSPMGLVHRADGTLLIAFAGSDEVWIVDDELKRQPTVVGGADLELVAPHGVADLGGGMWAASSPAGGAVAIFEHEAQRFFHGVARKDAVLAEGGAGSLAEVALMLRRGERAFYETTRSGISCQSCHLHAGTDSSPHDIGQQPMLPTLTVRGVTATSPYLRDGSFPRVRDLHHGLAEPLLRGYRRFFASRPEDLESFVESLPRALHPVHWRWIRKQDSTVVETLERGLPIFQRAACHSCHALPAFTHLGGHPVRSLFPDYGAELSPTIFLDTPSLLGIGAKGHWLQDGRADSLEAVLDEHNAANRHGDTAGLSGEEISMLVDFLGVL